MTAPGSTVLVPGDPAAVGQVAAEMRSHGDALHRAATALSRVDGTDGWRGRAGDLFRSAFTREPGRWQRAGDAFHRAGDALDRYRAVLQWAQDRAADAARLAAEGTDGAVQAAEEMLSRVHEQLEAAGDEAARAVEDALQEAPDVRRWPEQVGGRLAGLASDAVDSVAGFGKDVLRVAGDVTGLGEGDVPVDAVDAAAAAPPPPLPWDDPAVREKIPDEWGEGRENRSGMGHRWVDPGDQGNGVRIDQGNLNNSQPTQHPDHVVVRVRGKVVGRDGEPIPGAIEDYPEDAHIPLVEWKRWRSWSHP